VEDGRHGELCAEASGIATEGEEGSRCASSCMQAAIEAQNEVVSLLVAEDRPAPIFRHRDHPDFCFREGSDFPERDGPDFPEPPRAVSDLS
jgi:hypothetical protein